MNHAAAHAVPDALDRLLRREEVLAITGIKKTKLYSLIKAGKFPAPVQIGISSRWHESEVQAWKQTLPRGTRNGAAFAGRNGSASAAA